MNTRRLLLAFPCALLALLASSTPSFAAGAGGPTIPGTEIPLEFVFFGATLLGIALFHKHTLPIALSGLVATTAFKLGFSDFHGVSGLAGFGKHLGHEWSLLANLLGLLLGFALLANHFEESKAPEKLPAILPDDWKGGFCLLLIVGVLSSFLDNIAAAMIGGTIAKTVFKGKVHIGYLAAIVAASNAGGAGSVVGDTTTTMMWIAGVSPLDVIEASLGAAVAIVIMGCVAAIQQHKHQPIVKDAPHGVSIDWMRMVIVALILAGAIGTNVVVNTQLDPKYGDMLPWLGLAVWVVILATAPLRQPSWKLLPDAAKGSVFLLSLVLIASMMPVDKLPAASWPTTFGLGFVSSIFDNIPLTKLAIDQGGYDWGFLAYAVGFGGSMMWFGSSAGVALSNIFPEARSVAQWLRHGWHVPLAYVAGYLVMLACLGWHPHPKEKGLAGEGGAPVVTATTPH
jgi:Na+/H+ antiporter NhaD/arsenite permease-like protein